MTVKDLRQLYFQLQGSRYANTLLDAEAAFTQRDYAETIQLVEAARNLYRQSHVRTLRADPEKPKGKTKRTEAQIRDLKSKQEKCRRVLASFDEVLAALKTMAERRLGAGASPAAGSGATPAPQTASQIPKEFQAEFEAAPSCQAQLEVIRRYFKVKKVSSGRDIRPHTLYYLYGTEQGYLILSSETEPTEDAIPIQLALSGQRLRSLSRHKFLELGNRQRLVRLTPQAQRKAAPQSTSTTDDRSLLPEDSKQASRCSEKPADKVLDMGAFTQLLEAAKRSGLVPNADVIAHVRDREFRLEDYQKAFQMIDNLYGKFIAAATQRKQRLRREDTDIASGKIKISPKKLQEKRTRDTYETQQVERARNRFSRVLEGLRILMRT